VWFYRYDPQNGWWSTAYWWYRFGQSVERLGIKIPKVTGNSCWDLCSICSPSQLIPFSPNDSIWSHPIDRNSWVLSVLPKISLNSQVLTLGSYSMIFGFVISFCFQDTGAHWFKNFSCLKKVLKSSKWRHLLYINTSRK